MVRKAFSQRALSDACVPLIGQDERVAAGQITRACSSSASRLAGEARG
jgi:hypothetical protein